MANDKEFILNKLKQHWQFAIDKGELDTQHPIAASPVDNGKYTQNKP